jgi:hypothetical protein
MKLDFSALTHPSTKMRGQVGTEGTQARTRVPAPPVEGVDKGTLGDKLSAVVALAPDPGTALTKACPPASPACPQVPNTGNLNTGAVSPVSPFVPGAGPQPVAPDPLQADYLADDLPTGDMDLSYGQTYQPAEGIEMAAFKARAERFQVLGRTDAEELAQKLTLRDRDGDDRRLCLECTWLGDAGSCIAAANGRIPGATRRLEPVRTILQRCEAFGLRKGLV